MVDYLEVLRRLENNSDDGKELYKLQKPENMEFTQFTQLPEGELKKNQVLELRLCDESLFEQYGLSLLNSEQGMTRLNELYKKALTKTEDKELAWRFAESTALLEHLGDDRRACLECRYYKRHWEQNYGTCLKAGKANLTHMRHKANVCWYWLNRCPQNTARQRSEHV